MKKYFSILAVGAVIVGVALNLVGISVASQSLPLNHSEKINKQKAVPSSKIEIVKKVILPAIEKGPPENKGKPQKVRGAATGMFGEPLVEGANKYAVVIGISDYPGIENDIGYPNNYVNYKDIDATKMQEALITLYGYDQKNIYLYQDLDATFANISFAVNDIKNNKAKEGDEVVFYFSGHGGSTNDISGDEADGKDEMIICHEGIENKIVGILDDKLKNEWFNKDFPTSRVIFIFDSCLAGGMNDVANEGRIISMATTEGATAYAYLYHADQTTQGQFSYYFVDEGMLGAFADKYDHDGDKIVARGKNPGEGTDVVIEESFDYAKKKCRWQTPVIDDRFTDDLLFGYYSTAN